MRLAHKRKVQMKLQKRIKAAVANLAAASNTVKPAAEKPLSLSQWLRKKSLRPKWLLHLQ